MTETASPQFHELRRQLSANLEGKRLLYLDLLYWNFLCDAALGETDDDESSRLLRDLRVHVAAGSVVCPIEYTTFVELYKQRLPEKRRATAELIDELSTAVVIVSPQDRCFLEALRLAEAITAQKPFPPAPKDEVWTRPAFLLGHGELKADEARPGDLDRINAVMRAELWKMSFTQVLEQLGDEFPVSFEWAEETAEELNSVKEEVRKDFKNYREVYLAEVRGVFEAAIPAMGKVLVHAFKRFGGDGGDMSEQQRNHGGRMLSRLLAAAFEKHDLSAQLPTIHVSATLYASVQWDGPRRYRPNDILDFGHAAAALGYCNAFATERPLATLLRQSKLVQTYQTAVLANTPDVRRWLAAEPLG